MRVLLSQAAVAGLLVLASLPTTLASQVQLRGQALRDAVARHGNRVIIGLKPTGAARGLSATGVRVLSMAEQGRIASSLGAEGLQIGRQYRLIPAVAGVVAPARLDALLAHPNIEYIEPDIPRIADGRRSRRAAEPITLALADSMPYGVSKIRAPEAWAAATPFNDGAGVKVGVLDTGGDPAHPDLLYAGGYDAFTQSTAPAAWTDCDQHGTHVAGTIAARRGNGIGVVGVAPGVSLYALKFGDAACSLLISLELDAIQWAAANGIRVINMSFGSTSPSLAERQAIQAAEAAGVLFVAATGNEAAPVSYPAAFPEVIAVAATDRFDIRAGFSNFGVEVDVAAPGVGILSTVPGGYDTFDGTSMASPHVTGLVALLLASRSSLTPPEAAALLATGAVDVGLTGRDIATGAGRVDALNSVTALLGTTPPTPPAPTPIALGATPNLSGGAGSQAFYVLTVPNAAVGLTFTLSGGTGDADLYVGAGTRPTTGAYTCRSQTAGNNEICTIPVPQGGSWYVLVHGASAYAGLTLTASLGASTTQLQVTQQPAGAVSALVFAQQPVVRLADAQGLPVARPGIIVDVTIASGPGSLAPPSTPQALFAVTDANGVASFAGLGITGAGDHVLQFSVPQLAPGLTAPFTVTLPSTPDTLQRAVPLTGLAGAQGSSRLFVLDVPAGAIGLSLTLSGSSLPLMYASPGRYPTPGPGNSCIGSTSCVVPAPAAGPWYVLLSASFFAYSNVTLTATYLLPGAQLLFLTQPGDITAGLSYTFGQSAVLQLADAQGQPIAQGQIPVIPSVASGGGILQEFGGFADHHQPTDAFGRVTFRQISIDGAGPHTLQFQVQGLTPVVSQSFNVLTPPLTVLQRGDTAPNLSGGFTTATYFSLDVPSGVSSLTFTSFGGTGSYDLEVRHGAFPGNVENCSRVGSAPAQVTCSLTNPAPGTWYAYVGYRSIFSGVSLTADYTLGTVAGLSVTQQPAGAVTLIPFSQQPVVQLVDGVGAPVAMAGVPVTAAIASGSGQLGGIVLFSMPGKQATPAAQTATIVTDAGGRATFTDLSITGTGTHVLQFTAGGLTSGLPPGLSQAFDVAATPPITTLTDQVPVASLAGATGSRAFFVLTVPAGTASVTFETSGGSGDVDLLVQTGTLPSLANHACLSAGQTSTESCTITNPAAGDWYVMLYGFAPYTGVTLAGRLATAQQATRLTITRQPGGAVDGVPFTQQPIVQVADAQGAPVAVAGVAVTATIASGTGVITALGTPGPVTGATPGLQVLGVGEKKDPAPPRTQTTTVLTDANGTAVFTDLTITGTGTFTILFSATGLTPVTSAPFQVNSPVAATPLANNVPVTGLAGAVGTQQLFVLTIPAGQALVTASIAGGIGDADLYARYGAPPTLTTYDCRPFLTGNVESCQGTDPPATDLYVMIHGFTAYSGVVLTGTYSGTPTQLVLLTQPGGATSGAPLSPQPVVQLADAQGLPVFMSGFQVGATIASGSGTLGGATTAATGTFGVATFTTLAITGSGQHTLQFSSTGLTGVQSAPFTITGVGAAQLVMAQEPGGAVDGVPFTQQPAVQVADAQGQPVAQAGIVVTAAIQSGPGQLAGTSTATSNATGLAAFSNLAISGTGQHVLGFSAPGLTAARSVPFVVAGPPVTALQPNLPLSNLSGAQNSQTYFVLDVPAGAQVVAFFVSGGSGNVDLRVRQGALPTLATYDCLDAGPTNTATCAFPTPAAGSWYVMLQGASAYTGVTLVGNYNTTSSALRLSLDIQPAGAASGVPFLQQPIVGLADAAGQLVRQAGIVVTASLSSGAGQLGGTATATTDANGFAWFTNLSITGTGPHQLQFTSPGLSSTGSVSFTVITQVASQLLVTQQPGGAVSGLPLAQQPVIQLADAQGAAVPQPGVYVLATRSGGTGQLTGLVMAATNANGVASFSSLTITGSGAHTLTFSVAQLSVVSASFPVTSSAATQLVVTQQPGGAVTGIGFTQQPIVQVANAQGQPVAVAGASVTATIQSGAGTLAGTATVTTNASGAATFTNLSISPAGSYALRFTAAGLAAATSAAFPVVDPLAIGTPGTLPSGAVGAGYSQQLAVLGGTAPYTWSILAGALPAGLTLTPGTGLLGGTPAGPGAFAFTARVSDALARTAQQGFTLTVNGVPTVVVGTMVSALTGGAALSAAETALYDCNASAGFDVGDLLCYLDLHPGVSLSPEQLVALGELMPTAGKDAATAAPEQRKD